MTMAFIRRLLPPAVCAAAIALSGALAPPMAVAVVPCGTSLTNTLPAEDPSRPGQFSPERGPCDDSLPATPPLQPPALILPA